MTNASHKLPVIDIRALLANDESQSEKVAIEVDAAARSFGFFYILLSDEHKELVDQVLEASRNFYGLPLHEKKKVRAESGEGTGWEPSGSQQLDEGRLGEGVDGATKQCDRKESYILGRSAPSQRRSDSQNEITGIDALWPSTLEMSTFKAVLIKYHAFCEKVCSLLLQAMAVSLGQPRDYFSDSINCPMTKLRLLYYPAPSKTGDVGYVGAGSHCDWGTLTLLIQDNVGGLEVHLPSGEWIAATALPNTMLVNVGDMLQRWTGNRYVSVPHRVGKPPQERFSVAFFFNCNADAIIDPRLLMGELSGDAQQSREEAMVCELLPPISAEKYILERVAATYN